MEQYTEMICRHANKIHKAALPENERVDANGEEIVSCKWLPGERYEAIREGFIRADRATILFNIRRAFESINVTRENFGTLDYLFLPVLKNEH